MTRLISIGIKSDVSEDKQIETESISSRKQNKVDDG